MRWRTSDNRYQVEVVVLDSVQWLRVRRRAGGRWYLVGHFRTATAMAQAIPDLDLAELIRDR